MPGVGAVSTVSPAAESSPVESGCGSSPVAPSVGDASPVAPSVGVPSPPDSEPMLPSAEVGDSPGAGLAVPPASGSSMATPASPPSSVANTTRLTTSRPAAIAASTVGRRRYSTALSRVVSGRATQLDSGHRRGSVRLHQPASGTASDRTSQQLPAPPSAPADGRCTARSDDAAGGRGAVVSRTGGPFVTVDVLPTSPSTLRFPADIGPLIADRTPASHTPGRAS